MKYQKFIDSNIDSIVKFNRDYGYPRTIFDAYRSPSVAKLRIANFLDRKVKYYILHALNKKVERYGYRAYISDEGVSTYSKSSFNYCLQYKIFDRYSDKYFFYVSVVFTKNYVYISDNTKHNYRFAWNYDTDFCDIFYDWIELYAPDEYIYMH